MMMASPPVTVTLSGVTAAMDSSVCFFSISNSIWFFMFYSLTRISLPLAVIFLFLPHNTVVEKGVSCVILTADYCKAKR